MKYLISLVKQTLPGKIMDISKQLSNLKKIGFLNWILKEILMRHDPV